MGTSGGAENSHDPGPGETDRVTHSGLDRIYFIM